MGKRLRAIAGSLAIFAMAITGSQVSAAPDGATSTLEISEGASSLFYLQQGIRVNFQSKGARAEAELYLNDPAKISPTWLFTDRTASPANYSLDALRDLILRTSIRGARKIFGAGSGALNCSGMDREAEHCPRLLFETVRACWNSYVIGTPLTGPPYIPPKMKIDNDLTERALKNSSGDGATTAYDCVQAISKLKSPVPGRKKHDTLIDGMGIDYADAETAFTSASALSTQVTNQQVGGNDVQNRARAVVIAVLAITFIDYYNPDVCKNPKGQPESGCLRPVLRKRADGDRRFGIDFLSPSRQSVDDLVKQVEAEASPLVANAASPMDWLSSAGAIFGNCIVGPPTISGCIGKLSSVQAGAVAGVSRADMCAFSRRYWIPTLSQILQTTASKIPATMPDFGSIPGC